MTNVTTEQMILAQLAERWVHRQTTQVEMRADLCGALSTLLRHGVLNVEAHGTGDDLQVRLSLSNQQDCAF